MSFFSAASAALRSVSDRIFDVSTTGRAGEVATPLLAGHYKDQFEQVLGEIYDLIECDLNFQDKNNLKDIFTKNSKPSKQQLEDLELFKENLQLIKEMKTPFLDKDTLRIEKSQITFGDYVYKSSSSGNNTFVGWYKNNALVYGKITNKYKEDHWVIRSGKFKYVGSKTVLYAQEKGIRTCEKNGEVEIQTGEFRQNSLNKSYLYKGKLEQYFTKDAAKSRRVFEGDFACDSEQIRFVKGIYTRNDGQIEEGDFELIDQKYILVYGIMKLKDGNFLKGKFKYYDQIDKVIMYEGTQIDANIATTTSTNLTDKLEGNYLFFEGTIEHKTKDDETTKLVGIFKFNTEACKLFLVKGTKTLQDGTIYDGEFYLNTNSNELELLKGTIKYPDGQTEEVSKEEISNRKV